MIDPPELLEPDEPECNDANKVKSSSSYSSLSSILISSDYSDSLSNKRSESANNPTFKEDYYENYVIQANMCNQLSKEFDLPEKVFDDTVMVELPKEHGLSNAEVIIPAYYKLHEKPENILSVDFFKIIKDDIINVRVLNKYQMEYIKTVTDEHKYELIKLFNNGVKYFNEVMED